MNDENKRSKIIYVGNFHFPDGNAAGKRVFGNAKLFSTLGYNVSIIDTQKNYRNETFDLSFQKIIEGFICYSLPYPQNIFGWLMFYERYKFVREFLELNKNFNNVFAVVLYGSPTLSLFNLYLTLYCRKNGIKVISDCVDWLSINTKSILFNAFKISDDYFQKAVCNRMADGVICISSFLANYYRTNGNKVVIVPPLSAKVADKRASLAKLCEKKTFIYAGMPFRLDMKKDDASSLKDRVDVMLMIFSELKSEGYVFCFHIFGFTEAELLACMPSNLKWISNLAEYVSFHGQVSNDEVVSMLQRSHFSILIRDRNRSTEAGFPTKVAESINSGTPALATDVGDASIYIKDKINGAIAPVDDYNAQKDMVRKAIKLSNKDVLELKQNCLQSNLFTIEEYQETVQEFLNKI